MKKIGTPRPPKKDGAIKFQYGRNDGDLDFMVLFGNDVPRCDRALVMNVFTSQRPFLGSSARIGIAFADSFVVELENRGYDISTLRFSVERGGARMKPTIEGLLILALSVACVILYAGVEW